MRNHLLSMAVLAIMPLTVIGQGLELREGDAVVTKDRTNGTVKQIFPDGMVKVNMLDGSWRNFVQEYRIDQLSKPISCLGDICANDSVITSDHNNGNVKQVFPDGIVKVHMTDGSWARFVQEYRMDQLSKPISCLGDICANDLVVTSDRRNGNVKQVFPDGVVKVNMTDGPWNGFVQKYRREQLSLYKKCSEARRSDCRQ